MKNIILSPTAWIELYVIMDDQHKYIGRSRYDGWDTVDGLTVDGLTVTGLSEREFLKQYDEVHWNINDIEHDPIIIENETVYNLLKLLSHQQNIRIYTTVNSYNFD